LQKTLEIHADENLSRHSIGGAAMRVAQHGICVCSVYRGYKNVASQEPLVPNTMFRLASMTKPITGVACLLGLQNGWFTLDDKVSDHLTAYDNMYVGQLDENRNPVRSHPAAKDILIKHLLTHSSGIVSEDPLGNIQNDLIPPEALTSLASVVQYCAEHTYLSFEPGENTAYSGYAAFDIFARIIELKSGQTYAAFVQEHIFDPLGIKDMSFTPSDEQWSRMSMMCDKATGGYVTVDMGCHTFEKFPLSYACAGASLAGSVEDYGVFAEMLLHNGTYNGRSLVSSELFKLMKTPDAIDCIPNRCGTERWGLGVRVTQKDPILPAGTFGWSGAYGTHFWIDQENDITAIYMKNTRWHDSHGCGETGLQFERDVMSALQHDA
jgi:CubicO group peptidase (beta-lactamase class C family)